ncbi:MAG: hypothetical protein KDK39_18560 [Leptospiraceae bacterium]|nr:hypothetical protein [Leptospiraceae bacterium]
MKVLHSHIMPGALFCLLWLAGSQALAAQSARTRALPDPYYPQLPQGELRLNYYYDRSGNWTKFSDWIPFQQKKFIPTHLEDFYELYGLPHHYKTAEVKEAIYFLELALVHKFRHPRNALCKIENEQEWHKYRLLMHMQINLQIMRMYLRLGSLYDKRQLFFHDLDFADDLEISFQIARSYYHMAIPYWHKARELAAEAGEYRFEIDLPGLESERFAINRGKLDFDRIISRHMLRVESKLGVVQPFLVNEGRPRPVKKAMQQDMEEFNRQNPEPADLGPPQLNPEWKEQALLPDAQG